MLYLHPSMSGEIMKQLFAYLRAGLCVLLVCQLIFPIRSWGATGRDLMVEGLVDEFKEETVLWVMSVGVSQYEDARINLKYADHDAQRIAQMLKTQEGVLFKEVMTHVLVNEQATREGILQGMSEFLGQAGPGDVVLIFIAGHGLADRQTDTYYFVPHNANAENLIYAGLPMPMFDEAVKRLRNNVDKLILWMDTCHSGAATVGARGVNVGEDLAEALNAASGQYVLSASKAGEESLEDDAYRLKGSERGHGAFTFSLLKGLHGDAADSNKVVWLSGLFSHVSKDVPRLTRGKQHPYGDVRGTDLPLFVIDESVLSKASEPINLEDNYVPSSTSSIAPKKKGGSKKWLDWVVGGAAISGAAAIGLSGGGGGESELETGNIMIDVTVP